MYSVRTNYLTEDDFVRRIEASIKSWEKMMLNEERKEEYENVIWGAHRILDMLKVEYTQDNDII